MSDQPIICRNLHEFFLAVAASYDPGDLLPEAEQIALEDELIRRFDKLEAPSQRKRRPRLTPQQRAARRKRRALEARAADESRINRESILNF